MIDRIDGGRLRRRAWETASLPFMTESVLLLTDAFDRT